MASICYFFYWGQPVFCVLRVSQFKRCCYLSFCRFSFCHVVFNVGMSFIGLEYMIAHRASSLSLALYKSEPFGNHITSSYFKLWVMLRFFSIHFSDLIKKIHVHCLFLLFLSFKYNVQKLFISFYFSLLFH